MASTIPPFEEFADDVNINLGQANGNVYQRKEGVPGVHDGQILVRLKSKRFILLDYSRAPTEADMKAAELNPHITIHPGAGKTRCSNPDGCIKVGVPLLLYDSHPGEPASLYIRSGFCFQCQRNLNESRRADRKRKQSGGPSILYSLGQSQKHFKIDAKTVHLKSDAVILNGLVEGTRLFEKSSTLSDLGIDLEHTVRDALLDTERLRLAAMQTTVPSESVTLPTIDRHHHSELDADVVDAAEGLLHPPDPHPHDPASALSNNHHSTTGSVVPDEDVNTLYNKTFQSLHKAIILLSQWKAAFDSANPTTTSTAAPTQSADSAEGDPTLSEAVASAAAVAAAAADNENQTLQALLLAADKRKDDEDATLSFEV